MEGYLILSRKEQESIKIGDDIEVIVVQIQPGRVRLAVKAPKEVSVLRRELWEADRVGGK